MRGIIAALFLLPLLVFPAFGVELSDFSQAQDLMDTAQSYGVEGEGDLDQGLNSIFRQAGEQMGELVQGIVRTGLKLLAVVLLCALAETVCAGGPESSNRVVELAGAAAVAALTVSDMNAMIGLGRETIARMDDFAGILLPAMATVTAATGAVTGAAVRQGATVLFSDLLISAVDRLLVPLLYAYVAASCACAALGNQGLKKLAGLIRGTVVFCLTTLLLAFTGYLTASGAVAGTADAAAVKAARMTISRAVPVVGGVLSDAAETVLAGAGILKGTVGVVGMLVVLAICLTPFLQLAVHYLAYKGAAALTATVAPHALSGLMDNVGGAFGLMLGMTGSCALILMISLVSAVTAVVAT